MKSRADVQSTADAADTDAATAVAELLKNMRAGCYTDRGKRRKINGDFSKLAFAENLSALQRRLLGDVRFRCGALPGTSQIRVKICHLGFWASVVYGNGIFITVSPSERHNYLTTRLSRYRDHDLFADVSHRPWIGKDAPSLEPKSTDRFDIDIPGYDLRKLWMGSHLRTKVGMLG